MAKKTIDKAALTALKKDLESGDIRPVYLLYGPEKYLLHHYEGRLVETALGSSGETFNLRRFDGASLTPDELEGAVWTPPFGAPKAAVVVRDLDVQKDATWRQYLEELISDLPAHICLLFTYDALEFTPDMRGKLMKRIAETGRIVEFAEQERGDLVSWLSRRFRALSKDIARADAEYMIFRCGPLMEGLLMEVEKLASATKGERITREAIDKITIPALDAVIYELCDHVVDKKTAKAVSTYRELLAMKHETYVLLAAVSRQFRQLYTLKLLTGEGPLSERDAMELSGVRSPYAVRRMLGTVRKLDESYLAHAVVRLSDTDFLLKSADVDRTRELELLLISLSERLPV
ncbi:DNA polymerase III subunit delta [Oscillospiraceae bacterium OttesenSCG-928-G22]|nr:DNA polymerase III subunit delta [Oscillospiraceae bacterium OttesenSCG-928-G22]